MVAAAAVAPDPFNVGDVTTDTFLVGEIICGSACCSFFPHVHLNLIYYSKEFFFNVSYESFF